MKTVAAKRIDLHRALMFFAVLAGAVLLALTQSGCATMRNPSSPSALLFELALQNQVIKFIDKQQNPVAVAKTIIDVADHVTGLAVRGEVTTANAAMSAIRSRVDLDRLDNADRLTAEALLAYLNDGMEQEMAERQIPGAVPVIVERLAGKIKFAAGLVL